MSLKSDRLELGYSIHQSISYLYKISQVSNQTSIKYNLPRDFASLPKCWKTLENSHYHMTSRLGLK